MRPELWAEGQDRAQMVVVEFQGQVARTVVTHLKVSPMRVSICLFKPNCAVKRKAIVERRVYFIQSTLFFRRISTLA